MIIDELFEAPQPCPECGGISFSDLILAEKKDACYYKVKASAKVWPSAYASGRLVQCRKKGAGNYGNKSEGVAEGNLAEKINPKTLTRGFVQEKDMGWYTLQAVGDFASRMANEPPTMEIYAMLKPEAGQRYGKEIGQLSLKIAQGIFLKNNPGAEALVAGAVGVDSAYQRKGVASAMYQFAKELGNDVIASVDQSDDAVAMWKGMQAKGVAEGLSEMDKSQTPPGRDGSTDSDAGKKEYTAKTITPKKVAKHGEEILNKELNKKQGVAEGKADYNFDIEDLKRLERIRDLATLKAQALALISKPSAKPMKPEKVEWFKNALERMNSPMKVIKLMYDLLLSGEGNAVVGTRSSMNPNSYRQRFGEQGMAEGNKKSEPPEADYGADYQDMVARVKKLAGLGPMKTVYDPQKRVYRNVPTAVQPPKK